MTNLENNSYIKTLESLKARIKSAQIKAALSVNAELIFLYWEIGKTILERQQQEAGAQKLSRIYQKT